jgi:hypothetical protein
MLSSATKCRLRSLVTHAVKRAIAIADDAVDRYRRGFHGSFTRMEKFCQHAGT